MCSVFNRLGSSKSGAGPKSESRWYGGGPAATNATIWCWHQLGKWYSFLAILNVFLTEINLAGLLRCVFWLLGYSGAAVSRLRSNYVLSQQKRNLKSQPAGYHEFRLPQEWTYWYWLIFCLLGRGIFCSFGLLGVMVI